MATEDTGGGEGKTLEMRVAELEDKLARLNVTEEEMRAYQKVASLMGGAQAGGMQAGAISTGLSPQFCVINQCRIRPCIIRPVCIIQPCIIRPCIVDCTCGPCAGASSTGFGGDFGDFGMG